MRSNRPSVVASSVAGTMCCPWLAHMSRLVTIRVTKAEAQQLLAYVNSRDQGEIAGWYYSPKKDFERRHASLKEILERVLVSEPDTSGGSR